MDYQKKLDWARKRFDALDSEMRAFVEKGDTYVLVRKYDSAEGCYVAYLKEVASTPPDWSMMLGEIIHAMRSALDALVYALAVKNLGRSPTDGEVTQIQFPIVDELDDWPRESSRKLKHVHPDVRTFIETVQPYHRPDKAYRSNLAVLRDLNNVDKHRHIVVTLASAAASGIKITHPNLAPGVYLPGYKGPLKKGTVITRWKFLGAPPSAEAEVAVHGDMAVDIAFANEWPAFGGSVGGYLPAVHDYIGATVFPPLEKLLGEVT
jgi:hypothetical protein